MILPQNMMTEWYWSGSLAAFARVCNLRLDTHAQAETSEVACMIDQAMREVFPVSWEVLVK
jgi:thymidylate synthase (FAD)